MPKLKTVKIGIMPEAKARKRMLDIAAGRIQVKQAILKSGSALLNHWLKY